jgi:hypothetical protein
VLFFEGELTLSWARQEFPCRAFPAFLRSVFVFKDKDEARMEKLKVKARRPMAHWR